MPSQIGQTISKNDGDDCTTTDAGALTSSDIQMTTVTSKCLCQNENGFRVLEMYC